MKQRVAGLIIFFALAGTLGLSACGRKDVPTLPRRELPFRIEDLSATYEDGLAVLKGRLVKASKKETEVGRTEITGWRVYDAQYPIDNGPCEGCPLDFSRVYEMEGGVGEDGQFNARVALRAPVAGIHFFQVRLFGPGWAPGALSNQAKLVID
jgi:hypothetical protein